MRSIFAFMSKISVYFGLLLVLSILGAKVKAQELDSLPRLASDSVQVEEVIKIQTQRYYSPNQAALYSAVMPGMGQIYNRRYWKLPIIYGLGATLGYFIYWNNNRYLTFRDAVLAKSEERPEDDPFPLISEPTARLNQDFFQRNRDLLIILSVLLYGLNIVDASVDAHLRSFDVSEDLALEIKPYAESTPMQAVAGIQINLKLK